MVILRSDLRSAIQIPSRTFCCAEPNARVPVRTPTLPATMKARHAAPSNVVGKTIEKPSICTADELHYVSIQNSSWRLALWRYMPSPKAPSRNHPLLLLSGVGTNAIGFDLSPDLSFARFMSGHGFDTWILEVRGAGLSTEVETSSPKGNETDVDKSGFQQGGQISAIANQVKDLGQLSNNIESRLSVSPLSNSHEYLAYFLKQLHVIVKYDWDFDHYLEEDVPAAMEYIRRECRPDDGKILAIGHSMGGILLYALLSQSGFNRRDSGLAAVITLASSLDYSTSRSSLKLLLPLADPARALSVPVIPLGGLLAAAHPLASCQPYLLSWLSPQISAQNMLHPDLLEKLVLKSFCTVPANLLLQLTSVLQKGGLCDRNGTFFYRDHLHKTDVPVLALAGDQDLICPPEAVYETIKLIPKGLAMFKVLGEPRGPHYAHYDLVGGTAAANQVYPLITEFLNHHDMS